MYLHSSSLDHIELDSGEVDSQQYSNLDSNTCNLRKVEDMSEYIRVEKEFYTNQLMKPIIGLAGNKEEWIIVPDGLFFLLPIESLPGDAEGKLSH